MPIRVLLADDHVVLRHALARALGASFDLEVVAEAGDCDEVLRLFCEYRPDVTVMDISMKPTSGIEATRALRREAPDARILMLSMHEGSSFVHDALRAGARGYVSKRAKIEELVDAIRAVHGGGSFLSPFVSEGAVEALAMPEGSDTVLGAVSPREREVLRLIGEGLSSKEIAADLGISTRTVETHRGSLMRKLGIHKAPGLVRVAIREGLVSL